MPTTLTDIATALQTVFTTDADEAARHCGFVRRQRQLSGAAFVQTLVFGWLDNPTASLEDLTEVAARLGAAVAPQSLDERFTPQAAACLSATLGCALDRALATPPTAVALLRRCAGVYAQDSSTIALPAALAGVFPGGGGSTAAAGLAALKVQLRLELATGALEGLTWHSGRAADLKAALSWAPLPEGSLLLEDLGFFDLSRLQHYDGLGVYFLSRLAPRTALFDAAGKKWALADLLRAQRGNRLEMAARLGCKVRLPCRLLAVRVPEAVAERRRQRVLREARDKGHRVSAERLQLCGWTVLVTNAPKALLSLEEALVLRRARWQVELLFRAWKSEGRLDESRGQRAYRVLCEVLAKLLAMVVQQWALLAAGGPLECSPQKAARRVRRVALVLAVALGEVRRLVGELAALARLVRRRCRVQRRRGKPTTLQLLLDPSQNDYDVGEKPLRACPETLIFPKLLAEPVVQENPPCSRPPTRTP